MLKTMLNILLLLWGSFSSLLFLLSLAPAVPILVYVVSAESNSDIYIYDTRFQMTANLSNSPYPEWRGSWSQTGLFAYTATANLRDTDALYLTQDFSAPRRIESLRDSLIFGTSLSPNGKFLLYISSEPANYSEIFRVDLASETQLNFSNTPNLSETEAQWLGNETVVFLRGGNLYRMAESQEAELWIDAPAAIEKFAISPDSQYIAFHGLEAGERRIFIAHGSEFQALNLSLSLSSEDLGWSPDSHSLVFSLEDGSLGIYQAETGHLSRFAGAANRINPVWSPDGEYIAFMENRRIHLLEWRTNRVIMLDENRQIRPPLLWMPYRNPAPD